LKKFSTGGMSGIICFISEMSSIKIRPLLPFCAQVLLLGE
jgi:hypothetical protein